MPAQVRELYKNAIYHVYTRGNCRKTIFKSDQDFSMFLKIVSNVRKKYNFDIFAYCLMTNHYHFLIRTPDANLPEIMFKINQNYAHYFNRTHNEVGYVFQGRYQAKPVKDEKYFLNLLAYIHLNPIHAGLVCDPGDWEWSSYKSLIENKSFYSFMHLDYSRSVFGVSDFRQEFLNNLRRNMKVKLQGLDYDNWYVQKIFKPELRKELEVIDKLEMNKGLKSERKVICVMDQYFFSACEAAEILNLSISSVKKIHKRLQALASK